MYYVIKYKRASRFRPLPSSPLRGEGEGGVGKQRNAMRCLARALSARATLGEREGPAEEKGSEEGCIKKIYICAGPGIYIYIFYARGVGLQLSFYKAALVNKNIL